MKNMIGCLVAAGALSVSAETVLWPADGGIMCAQPSSKLEEKNGVAFVSTGTGYEWPGVRLDFREGTRDMTGYSKLTVALTNPSPNAVQVALSVKSRALQGSSPGGSVTLAPYASGAIVARLGECPWRLDKPLELVGMRGYPAAAGSTVFNIRQVESLHIFRTGEAVDAQYAVTRVTAADDGPATAVKLLKADSFKPFVDVYGQFRHDDWPGKVHSDAELKAAATREEKWLKARQTSPIRDCDAFGGWAGGPQLKATGYFRTEKVKGKWWFVDPEGRLFFSHGIDCIHVGDGATGVKFREDYFAKLPAKDDPVFGRFWGRASWRPAHGFYNTDERFPYETYNFAGANMVRKYGDEWWRHGMDLVHRRLRAWGVNTIGNWSNEDICRMDRTPYTLCLGTYDAPRLEWAKGWWGKLPDPAHPEFERRFREKCRKAAGWMKTDKWCLGVFVDNELSWSDDPRIKDVAERYFATVSRVLGEELPNHLYLGCRIAWGGDDVYRAAARHCDVVSVNVYAHKMNRDLPAGAADKPMINGEFHFGALDRGMFHTGLVPTDSQAERAACYRDYVNSCLDHPRMIGTHWFQWKDQPLTGRPDEENYQIGFLTVTDAPYPELVKAAREVAAGMYERRYDK